MELCNSGLAEEEDKFLLEINLEDLETTSGETQEYWLLAIFTAHEACVLREQGVTGINFYLNNNIEKRVLRAARILGTFICPNYSGVILKGEHPISRGPNTATLFGFTPGAYEDSCFWLN